MIIMNAKTENRPEKILVTGGGGLLPERGQLFAVETHWRRIEGDWMLTEANWEAVH